MTSIIQDSKRVDYRYGQGGQLALLKRFDGGKSVVETTYDYDTLGRVKNIDHASADKVFADYDFTWDASGRITDFDIDSLVGVKGDSSYDYDKTGQLTGADHSNQNDETYQYDANGNRSNYETGDHNRLLSDGTYRYMYDAEGNRVSKTSIATGEKEEYTWDHRNRLTKVVFKNASGQEVKIVEYAYDYGQRLVRKTLDTNADGVIEKNSIFVYDSGQIAMEYEGNLLAHKYLWGSKVDELLASNDDWALTDHLGSVRDVVSKDGVVKNHIVYDSFGNVTSQTGTATPLFLYTGKLFDADTRLQNNLNRWYDGRVGRWLSVDPIGFGGRDANLYRYVGNSTNVYVDPNGQNVIESQLVVTLPAYTATWEDLAAEASQQYNISETWRIEVKFSFTCDCGPNKKLVLTLGGPNPPHKVTMTGTHERHYIVHSPTQTDIVSQNSSEYWSQASFKLDDLGYPSAYPLCKQFLLEVAGVGIVPHNVVFFPNISLGLGISFGTATFGVIPIAWNPNTPFINSNYKTTYYIARFLICCKSTTSTAIQIESGFPKIKEWSL